MRQDRIRYDHAGTDKDKRFRDQIKNTTPSEDCCETDRTECNHRSDDQVSGNRVFDFFDIFCLILDAKVLSKL